MANTIFSRIALALMSILFVNIGSICAQSTTGQQPNIFKSEVGAPLQSTGTVQIQTPKLGMLVLLPPICFVLK